MFIEREGQGHLALDSTVALLSTSLATRNNKTNLDHLCKIESLKLVPLT